MKVNEINVFKLKGGNYVNQFKKNFNSHPDNVYFGMDYSGCSGSICASCLLLLWRLLLLQME